MHKSISLYSGIALHKTRETLLAMGAFARQQKSRKGEPMRLLAKQEAD
jgi:hypothetical protein